MIAAFRYFVRPYRRWFWMLGAVMLIASLLEGLTVAAFFPVFLAVMSPADTGELPRVLRMMVEATTALPWADPVIASAVLLGGVLVLRTAVLFGRDALIAATGGRILYDLRQRLLTEYANVPYHVLTAEKQGVLVYRAVVAPGSVALVLQRVPQCLAEALKIAAIGGILLATFPSVTAVLAALLALYVVATRRLSSTLAYDTGAGRSASYADQMELAQQLFTGIRHLRVYRAEGHWLSRFEQSNRRYRELYVKYLTWLAVPRNVMELGAVLLLMGAIVIARATRADDFALWLPALGLFALATVQLLPSLTSLGRMWMEIHEAGPDLERLHEVVTQPAPIVSLGDRPFGGLSDGITFDRVGFGYDPQKPILRGLTFTLRRGEVTAIVGASGTGKTTILNLLLGLLQPSAGAILVDGTPLHSLDSAGWLGQVGFVSQDPFIFHGTVAENIRFGRQGVSDAAVAVAAALAHADEFIRELPNGYATVVGERGSRLSGGQQQRLAIARAVLGNPAILILDEPTSALDDQSEQRVHEALLDASKNRTVILVTHDEKVLPNVQQVIRVPVYQDRGELAGAQAASA